MLFCVRLCLSLLACLAVCCDALGHYFDATEEKRYDPSGLLVMSCYVVIFPAGR